MSIIQKARQAYEEYIRGGTMDDIKADAIELWEQITDEKPTKVLVIGEEIFIEEEGIRFVYDPGEAFGDYFRIADYKGKSLDIPLVDLEDIGEALSILDLSIQFGIQSGLSTTNSRLGSDGIGEASL